MTNCPFNTGDFTGWTNTGDVSNRSVDMMCGHSGSYCAHMGPVSYVGQLTQVLTTTPGQTYTLSFWVRNTDQPNQFKVWWGDETTPLQSKVTNLPDFDYTQFTYFVKASGPSTPLTFAFYNVPDFTELTDIAVY